MSDLDVFLLIWTQSCFNSVEITPGWFSVKTEMSVSDSDVSDILYHFHLFFHLIWTSKNIGNGKLEVKTLKKSLKWKSDILICWFSYPIRLFLSDSVVLIRFCLYSIRLLSLSDSDVFLSFGCFLTRFGCFVPTFCLLFVFFFCFGALLDLRGGSGTAEADEKQKKRSASPFEAYEKCRRRLPKLRLQRRRLRGQRLLPFVTVLLVWVRLLLSESLVWCLCWCLCWSVTSVCSVHCTTGVVFVGGRRVQKIHFRRQFLSGKDGDCQAVQNNFVLLFLSLLFVGGKLCLCRGPRRRKRALWIISVAFPRSVSQREGHRLLLFVTVLLVWVRVVKTAPKRYKIILYFCFCLCFSWVRWWEAVSL